MAGTFYQRDGRITSSATESSAMTDAPRTIWATPFDEGITSGTYAAEEMLPKLPPNGDAARYHHDAVVREMVEAAQAMLDEKDDYMRRNNLGDPMKETVSARVRAALARIAQEGKP